MPPCDTWRPAVALITLRGSLNWATITAFVGIAVVPFAGLTATTAGPCVCAVKPVVNSKKLNGKGLPERSRICDSSTKNNRPTAYCVCGTNDAVNPEASTCNIPCTGWPVTLSITKNVCDVSDAGLTGLLNSTINAVLVGTPAVPLAGLVSTTCPGVASTPMPVVNELWNAPAIGTPDAAFTPWTTMVYVVEEESA